MLDKNRIRLMTKMASYENTLVEEDLKISGYYRRDYVSLKTLVTALWTTVGYVMAAGLFVLCNLDALLKNLTMAKMFFLAAAAVGIYIILMVVFCMYAHSFYKKKHNMAKLRVKKYYRNLSRAGKMYMKEKNVK